MPTAAPAPAVRSAVSSRAVCLGLFGAVLLCALTPYNDYKVAATYLAGTQFPIGALWALCLLVGVNTALRRFRPRHVFGSGELLTIWTLMLVASGLPASGMMRYFLPHIVAPQYLSDPANGWEQKVWRDTPHWLKLHDKQAIRTFYEGYPRGQEQVPWGAWAGPLFFWGLLALLFFTATFCMASLLRRQWIENERFAFPLVALPVLLTEEPMEGRLVNRLLRSGLFWVGVGVCAAIHTQKGLHLLYPSIPDVPLRWNFGDFLTSPPFNQIGLFPALVFLLVVGFAFLLPAEVSFSLWFFFLFFKLEILIGVLYNGKLPGSFGGHSQKLFHGLQAFGGALALFGYMCWTARGHLRGFWYAATEGGKDDGREMLAPRATLLGLAVSYGGIALWMALAGVSAPQIALLLLTMTLAFVLIGWMVCQGGMLFMMMPFGAFEIFGPTLGTAPFKTHALYTVHRFEAMFLYDTREMLLPSVLNGAKVADAGGFPVRRLFGAMVASVVVGLGTSLVAALSLPYHYGGANSLMEQWGYRDAPKIPLQFLGNVASVPYAGSGVNGLHIAGGFVGVLGLLLLRARTGIGLHPIGFLGASIHAGHTLWFSMFLGWLCKSLLLRYGGMRGYLAGLPFFLGLIVGDTLSAVFWMILGHLTGVGYMIMPD